MMPLWPILQAQRRIRVQIDAAGIVRTPNRVNSPNQQTTLENERVDLGMDYALAGSGDIHSGQHVSSPRDATSMVNSHVNSHVHSHVNLPTHGTYDANEDEDTDDSMPSLVSVSTSDSDTDTDDDEYGDERGFPRASK